MIVSLLHERRRRRIAEMNAHQRMAELAHLNRRSTVGELSASITHELTQPLSAIGNNTEAAELILGTTSPDLHELKEINADIARDQRRAIETIKRLRRLLTKSPTETQVVDLSEVVREVFEFLSAQAAAHHVTLSTSLSPRPLLVSGDPIHLQQVVLNLLMNGMEAIGSAASSERTITARTAVLEGAVVEVAIEDSGPGIPPDKVEQIFEPFFTTKDAGMGMGLAITRTIVVSHGGRIWAANRPEGGAVVRFILPLAKMDRGTALVQGAAKHTESVVAGPRVSGAFGAAIARSVAGPSTGGRGWRTE